MEISIGIYALIFIFFFIFIPGFIARRFYCNGEFSKQVNWSSNTMSNVLSSLIVGFILTLLFISLFNLVSSNTIDVDSILKKFDSYFISAEKEPSKSTLFDGFSSNFYKYYFPFLSGIYLFCAFLGFALSRIILILGLDTKVKFLRFNNNWHYLFTGKILKFKKIDHDNNISLKVKYTYLDILVQDKGDDTSLYSGLFADYDLSCDNLNKLEKIYLYKATRYKKKEDGFEVKSIPGNIFTIMADRIVNINCTYVCHNEDESKEQTFKYISQLYNIAQLLFALFFVVTVISLIFSFNLFQATWYSNFLAQSVWVKLLVLFALNVTVGILTPIEINAKEKKIKFIAIKSFIGLVLMDTLMVLLIKSFWSVA